MYKRVLIKISGESLKGDNEFGFCAKTLKKFSKAIKEVYDLGIDIGIVVGGGNIFRGVNASNIGMDRTQADYMGMLATIMNGLAIQDSLEKLGISTRVLSSIQVNQVTEPYIRRRAVRHLEKRRICIFVGGVGSPYFSTDTASVLRATEIGADVILMGKNMTDGIYDADPKLNKDAIKYDKLSFDEIIQKNLQVMDGTAATLCKDNNIDLIVFNMNDENNMIKVVKGEKIGTVVSSKCKV